jgi:hypothetical protein
VEKEAKLWREKGSLNSAYLTEYTPTFIQALQEYQFLAD